MAKEIILTYTPGATLYAVILNAARQAWKTSAFEAINGANWDSYAVALAAESTTPFYTGTFPAGITAAGGYLVVAFLKVGATRAVTDTPVGSASFDWDGSKEITLGNSLDFNLGNGRTPREAFHRLRNKVAPRNDGKIAVYQTDDVTESWTAAVTKDAAAKPITAFDPD